MDVCLTGVVYMLLTSSPADQLQLLQLCKLLIQRVILTHSGQLRCVLGVAVYPVLQLAISNSSHSTSIVGQYETNQHLLLAKEMLCALESCIYTDNTSHGKVLFVNSKQVEVELMLRLL